MQGEHIPLSIDAFNNDCYYNMVSITTADADNAITLFYCTYGHMT